MFNTNYVQVQEVSEREINDDNIVGYDGQGDYNNKQNVKNSCITEIENFKLYMIHEPQNESTKELKTSLIDECIKPVQNDIQCNILKILSHMCNCIKEEFRNWTINYVSTIIYEGMCVGFRFSIP